jgi:hypothetical protein
MSGMRREEKKKNSCRLMREEKRREEKRREEKRREEKRREEKRREEKRREAGKKEEEEASVRWCGDQVLKFYKRIMAVSQWNHFVL